MKILNNKETFDKIINERLSISRFGDGELYIMNGGSIGFQYNSIKLQNNLLDCFIDNNNKCLLQGRTQRRC